MTLGKRPSQPELMQQNTMDLGGLTNEHLFLAALRAGKFKIKVPTDTVTGEDPPSGFRWLFSPCALPWWRAEYQEDALVCLLIRALIPPRGLHPHGLISSEKTHHLIPSCRGSQQGFNI